YDFGDSWEHEIVVEKILSPEAAIKYPMCINGKLTCPPEDVGGVWGYDTFLEAINDPNHEEHDSYLEWIGGEFNPEEFNLDEINQALRQVK
ncbi:MAG TPA: plasmid pRiA4b ORF-3 family protein, partial [Thermodesulfovibrionia bacterium]|nr:plasmid pRiA4b ORF-3 family protein [Thermodesulfovibrionia bacterium]